MLNNFDFTKLSTQFKVARLPADVKKLAVESGQNNLIR